MVRVISVHHFTYQDVRGLSNEDGHGVSPGKGNLLFIGGYHKIDIHDLKNGGALKGNFPTVDLVQQLIYSAKGNYVGTLESKAGDKSYVRVYLGWEKESSGQPMKARIAGRVTPDSQSNFDTLEMVEIPMKKPAEYIACCKTSGNLAVSSGVSVAIFKCCIKIHDISKVRFVDFDEIFEIEISFIAKEVAILEDVLGVVSNTEAHVFHLVLKSDLQKTPEAIQEEIFCANGEGHLKPEEKSRTSKSECSMTTFRGRRMIQKEGMFGSTQLIRKADDYVNLGDFKWFPTLSYLKNKTVPSDKFMLFPSLVGPARCGVVTDIGEVFGPMSASECSSVQIKLITGQGSSQRVSTGIFEAVTLLYRRIDQTPEPDLPFSNLLLTRITSNREEKSPKLKKPANPLLPGPNEKSLRKIGLSVFFTTPHVGYLYHITLASNPFETNVFNGANFSYTAPVDTVAMEPYLLHALTLTGLETYSLRPHPYIIESLMPKDYKFIVPPRWEESMCLVGLRPFLNVESMTLTDSCLALITANEEVGENSRTAYSLHLPIPASLYKEMIRVGSGHKTSSPSTYMHLLLEAHLVLLTAIKCQKDEEDFRVIPEEVDGEDLASLLQESSALLGEYYASCSSEVEWNQSVQYYQASGQSVDVILQKLSLDAPGLVYIVKALLLQLGAEELTAKQANCVLDILDMVAPHEVSNLFLQSSCMKKCKKDRVLSIIKQEIAKSPEPRPVDVLALALLIQEKGSADQVVTVLTLVKIHHLVEILLKHSHLLFTHTKDELSLSPFSQVLLEHKREVFLEAFALLIGEGTLSLDAFVDAFVSVYPIVSCGVECNLNSLRLRDFIENFFLQFGHHSEFSDQTLSSRAISVLISLYIASLLGAFSSESDEEEKMERRSAWINLFGERPSYLNHLPPFHSKPPTSDCKLRALKSQESLAAEGKQEPKRESSVECVCQQCCIHLLFLQSLLSTNLPAAEDRASVSKFATSNPEIRGSSSLRMLCLDQEKRLPYIVEHHPNALLQYCKDSYSSPKAWREVVVLLIDSLSALPKDDPQYQMLDTVLNEVLGELALTSPLEVFTEVLPAKNHDQFKGFLRLCHSTGVANFLKDIFVSYADNVLQEMNGKE